MPRRSTWRVLVTGAGGLLGRALMQRLAAEANVTPLALTRRDADFSHAGVLREALLQRRPDVVINAAAFTAVDAAEQPQHHGSVLRINAEAVREAALACEACGARLLQVSTDYVFDGASQREPYSEDATPRPLNWYGISKLAGEHAASAYAPRSLVVRTGGLFSPESQRNFVARMLRRAGERHPLHVVDDQTVAPTYAPHLADAVWRLLCAAPEISGTVHLTAQGATTWYRFACALFTAAGLAHVEVHPTSSAAYASPAKRPPYSLLANETLARLGLDPLPDWQTGLRDHLAAMGR